MITEKVRVDDARALEVVPLWLRQEALYANEKFRIMGMVCSQQELFNGGLEPGRKAYQDFYNYYQFKNFLASDLCGRRTVLHGSRQLGKFVNQSRALVSVVIMRELGLPTLDDADEITFERMEQRLDGVNQVTYDLQLGEIDHHEFFNDSVVHPLAEIALAAATGDATAVIELAEPMLDDHAHLFAAFTRHHGIIAQPGVSSGRDATEWLV